MTTLQVQLKTPPYDPKKNFLEYHTTIFLTQSNLQESMMSNFDILAQYFHRLCGTLKVLYHGNYSGGASAQRGSGVIAAWEGRQCGARAASLRRESGVIAAREGRQRGAGAESMRRGSGVSTAREAPGAAREGRQRGERAASMRRGRGVSAA